MPKFVYTLKDEKGRDYQGSIQAKDKKEAQAALDTTGYYLTSLRRIPQVEFPVFARKITKMDVIVFSRQLATMLGTGLPITRSLSAIAEQSDNEAFKVVVNDIRTKIEGGFKLSEAMAKHSEAFTPFFVSLVRTGEASGIMDKMFIRLSTYLEKEEDLRKKVKAAFAYPMIVSIVATLVVTYLVMFVVPVFQEVYKSLKVDLPMPTQILLTISAIGRKAWLPIAIGIGGLIFGYRVFSKSEQGSYILDRIKISMPIMGPFNKKVAVSRFIRSFGSMISSGISIAKALDVSEAIADNKVVSKVVEKMKMAVNRGDSISGTLRYGRIFPPIVVQMVSAGEESGTLDVMLDKSADFIDEDIDESVKQLTVKLEPILTVGLALVVGFIAMAIYLPMFDVIKQISK